MDRRVKERLVGASILVVLIVLIVPALLSGPAQGPAPAAAVPGLPVSVSAPEPIRNVTVDLTTSKPPAPEPAASAAQAAASSAASAASAASAMPGSPVVPPAQARNQETPGAVGRAQTGAGAAAPLETASLPPTSTVSAGKPAIAGRGWTVQLGSFASHDNADKLLRQLRAQGFAAFVSPSGSGPSLRYRVRIGPMADRGSAAQAVAKLKGFGHAASIVAAAP
jgi:DedD protein